MKRAHLMIATLPPALFAGFLALFWEHLAQTDTQEPAPTPPAVAQAAEPAPSAPATLAGTPVVAPSFPPQPAGTPAEQPVQTQKSPSSPEDYQQLFQMLGTQFSQHPLWRQFVQTPQALEILVTAIDQIASGKRPLALGKLEFLPAPAPFKVAEANGTLTISEETQQRWTPLIDALLSVSPENAARLIQTLKPELDRLVQQKLGYPPEQNFRSLLTEALTVLLKTPMPTTPPELVRVAPGLYHFQNQQLEQLNPAQKFLLRTGLHNQARLADYARKIWPLF